MLEATLEQLLLRFLAPYVDGISRDKLHVGVFSGCLELKDLQVKPDALALLGLEGFRVKSGSIRMIRLSIPLSKIVNGKLRALVQMVRLEVEQIGDSSASEVSSAQIIEEVRDSKRKAVEIRVAQLRDLLEQQREQVEAAESGGQSAGNYAVKLLRKIVNNIYVDLSDIKVALASRGGGLACGCELPELTVLSTDQTFRERAESEEVSVSGSSMYKLMRLRGLGLRMSLAGSDSLDGADYVLSPISASLQLAHVPSDQILRVRMDVATEEVAELTLLRSQAKHLRTVQAATLREAARLRALLVPPHEERAIQLDPLAAAREYGALYEQQLSFEWKLPGCDRRPLNQGQKVRLQLLEDALSVRLLAKHRLLVHDKLEALNEEIGRRFREIERARVEAERRSTGVFRRATGYSASSEGGPLAPSNSAFLSTDAQRELLLDLGGESKLEAVDLPSRLKFEFVLGKVALELVDDRWPDEVSRQLLSLALQDVRWQVSVDCATDHRGQDSTEWQVECCLSAFRALHAARITFRFRPPEEADATPKAADSQAARLVFRNKLEPEQNLLQLQFDFAPLEVHLLHGVLEQLLEFFRAPDSAEDNSTQGVALEELVAAHSEVAERVYEQIPDKVQLDLRIASPTIFVPVQELGIATFSLGELHIHTLDPCAYSKIVLAISLKNTALQAASIRGEKFSMIEPVTVDASFRYKAFEEESSLEVHIHFGEAAITLAPQALQILLGTPTAMASIMSVPDWPVQLAFPTREPAEEEKADVEPPSMEELLRDTADARMPRQRQFRLNVAAHVDALDITLTDSIMPILRLRSRTLHPGLVLYWQSLPHILAMDIDDTLLELEVKRPQVGVWEPLVERIRLGFQVVRTPEGGDNCSTHLVVSGREPLLLNLTPSAIRQVSGVLPLFSTGLGMAEQGPHTEEEGAEVKYRVVNLCDYPMELEFISRHRSGLTVQIQPTGSAWESLDDWVLPNFATSVRVRVPGCQPSEPLPFERPGLARIPESSAVAELLAPQRSQRLLLLATALRLHNRTDFPLLLRFHDAVQREVLMVDVPPTATCNATVLGMEDLERRVTEFGQVGATTGTETLADGAEEPSSGSAVALAPNALCAVPAAAMIRARLSSAGGVKAAPRVWLSIQPVGLGSGVSPTVEAGAGTELRLVTCHRGEDSDPSDGPAIINLMCESVEQPQTPGDPSAPSITTVVLRPPLALLNALPTVELRVGYAPGLGPDSRGRAWREAKVPRLARLSLYGFSGVVSKVGLSVCARMEVGAPWSPVADFDAGAFGLDSAGAAHASQTLPLRQRPAGAAAGLLVEVCGTHELRLSCPNWFVDRSGLSKPLVLEILRDELLLPTVDGITFLPSDCLEEQCTLVLRSACSKFAQNSLRIPPHWGVLAWRTNCGPFVFCLQTDDVVSSDIFGAQCQVTTIRPRLVLTNASPYDVELQLSENKLLRLPTGLAVESHWFVVQSEEDLPAMSLRFRPLRDRDRLANWSGEVLCADSTAGSTPILLSGPGSEKGDLEVWSVEVSPDRGALSMSLKAGSDFVAVNRAVKSRTPMTIRTVETSRPQAAVVPPLEITLSPGEEAPYGWRQPFLGQRHRSVEVLIQGVTCRFLDVRKIVRRVLRPLGLVLSTTRRGSQTLLVLEDCELSGTTPAAWKAVNQPLSPGQEARSGGAGAWLQKVEVKLSHIGVSIVGELPQPPRELLYLHLELVRLEWRCNEESLQQLKLVISEMQLDCQLPDRADARTVDRRRNESLGLLQRERPAVIFANCGDGDRAFLSLLVQRSSTSSRDLLLPHIEVAVDSMDVTLDDAWLDPMAAFLSQACPGQSPHGRIVGSLLRTAGRPITEGHAVPTLPPVVQVDSLQISSICLTVWCTLRLRSVRFLPAYVRAAIRVLSLSGRLTLDGASLRLPARRLPAHRGSLSDFVQGLASEYTVNLLRNTGSVLGKSSVLNLPRVPLKIGGTAVSYVADSIGLAAGEAASLLSQLTFDDDYVLQQRRLRSDKRIRGVGDGVVEAGKSLAQGVEGILDVVKKPAEGARRDGLGGLLAGVGKGMAGSLVKPISKLGQAISDAGSGIAAQVTPDSASMKRRRGRARHRQPRLLSSACGVVRPWSVLEAELQRQNGPRALSGVEEVLPLTQSGSQPTVLLLFAQRLLVLQVQLPPTPPTEAQRPTPRTGYTGGGSSSSSSSGVPSGCSGIGGSGGPGWTGGQPTGVLRQRPPDIADAVDETAFKLFLQALKPINTLVYNMQDLRHAGDEQGLQAAPRAGFGLSVRFADLVAVRAANNGDVVELEEMKGPVVTLPLYASPLGQVARTCLIEGLQATLHVDGHVACWHELRSALRNERTSQWHLHGDPYSTGQAAAGSGERVLEVLEVERRNPAAAEWQTPFLPTDGELTWRWVDATGCRHPHLIPHLSRLDASSMRRPPCRLDALFRSSSEWVLEVSSQTDSEGWRYGLAWNSSTWDSRPGMLDGLRRRRWTRTYV